MKSTASSQILSLPPSRAVALKLGGYRPCLEIGSGGMATVYIARELEHSGLQRTVALKVMHDHLSRTDRFKKRFLDEARLLSRLSHPFVCRVFSYGEDDGRPFMAMEYLVGEPLSRVLRTIKNQTHELNSGDRARLFGRVIADIAEGLHSAHETRDNEGQLLGVIHRDVSPQNLFMMYDGTVRILDFGIAWYKDRYVNTATTSRLVGKLPYMAPEQVRGNEYDRRVDVWALGVILWELVTLVRLFRRDTEVQTMEAVCFEPIPFIGEVSEGIPPGFDHIVARALQRDPDKRYQTARELAHDLEMWLARNGQPVTHGDMSQVLDALFPGSEQERRRWADVPPHSGNARRVPQVDFASEALAAFDTDTSSLELLPRAPRVEDLTSSEFIPPQVLRDDAERATLAKAVYDVTNEDLLSNPPSTNASPVAVSVRKHDPVPASQAVAKHRWQVGSASIGLGVGLLLGVIILGTPSHPSENAAAIVALARPPEATTPIDIVRGAATNSAPRSEAWPYDNPAASATEARTPEINRASSTEVVEPSSLTPTGPSNSGPSNSGVGDGSSAAAPSSAPARREFALPNATLVASPAAQVSTKVATSPVKPAAAATSTGDVLIVSPTRGTSVYIGSRLLGQTPLRTRLPTGATRLSVQQTPAGPRTTLQANITPDRLNVISAR